MSEHDVAIKESQVGIDTATMMHPVYCGTISNYRHKEFLPFSVFKLKPLPVFIG